MTTEIYGCDINEFEESVRESGTDFLMAAMSILSDCQEMMYCNGDSAACREDVRQAMNRSKYLISRIRRKIGREQMEELSQ